MIYPSERAVWLAVSGAVPAFLVALASPAYWYAGLSWICALIAFALVDAAAGPNRDAITAHVTSAGGVAVGRTMSVAVTVAVAARARGRSPARVEVRLADDPRLSPALTSTGLRLTDGNGIANLELTAVRRGKAVLDRLWLRWRGPFGLVWKQAVLPVDHRITVTPDIGAARDQAVALLRRDALAGDNVQRNRGLGREFDALAEYQPGMGRRSIDWKRSARHGRLLAKEYRAEQNNDIVLAIDCGRLMCEPIDGQPKVDRAVTASLFMALVALNGGDLVSLFAFDSRPRIASAPARGVASFALFQQLAADIDYSAEETNFTLALTTLAGKLTRRSLVVMFTDFVDPISAELMLRTVGHLTAKHLVLFVLLRDDELEQLADAPPDQALDVARAVTAGAMLRERRVVIARLHQLGAQVIEAGHREIGPRLVARYLDLKRADAL